MLKISQTSFLQLQLREIGGNNQEKIRKKWLYPLSSQKHLTGQCKDWSCEYKSNWGQKEKEKSHPTRAGKISAIVGSPLHGEKQDRRLNSPLRERERDVTLAVVFWWRKKLLLMQPEQLSSYCWVCCWWAFYSPCAPGQYRNISSPNKICSSFPTILSGNQKNQYRCAPYPFPALHCMGEGEGAACANASKEVLSNDIFLYPVIIDDQAVRTEINVTGSQKIV